MHLVIWLWIKMECMINIKIKSNIKSQNEKFKIWKNKIKIIPNFKDKKIFSNPKKARGKKEKIKIMHT